MTVVCSADYIGYEDSGWNEKSVAVTVVCSADYIPTVGGWVGGKSAVVMVLTILGVVLIMYIQEADS